MSATIPISDHIGLDVYRMDQRKALQAAAEMLRDARIPVDVRLRALFGTITELSRLAVGMDLG